MDIRFVLKCGRAVVETIWLARQKGLLHLWLETDSLLVVHYFKAPILIFLGGLGENSVYMSNQMNSYVSHIFREGNSIADVLANYGATHHGSHWCDALSQFLVYSYGHYISSRLSYRFA